MLTKAPLGLLALLATLASALPAQSTYTVTNLNDSGAGSLRAAIAAASTATQDVVDFQVGLNGTITLASSLTINKPLKLVGPATSPGITVSGNSTVRCFYIGSSAPSQASTVEISNLKILNGASAGGGGMFVGPFQYSLNFSNVTFEACNSTSRGGALEAMPTGAVTLTNCTFQNNTSSSGGAAVYMWVAATFTGCGFTGNTTPSGGGGIYSETGVNLNTCSFTNNTAQTAGGLSAQVPTTLTGCTFTGNKTTGSVGQGGAASISGGSGTLTIANCGFDSNQSQQNDGGALIIASGNAVISDSTFTSNSAFDQGGAIWHASTGTFSLTNCTFTSNSAGTLSSSSGGAAVYVSQGNATLNTCHFGSNVSVRAAGALVLGGGLTGATISNCTFTGNSVTTNGGGGAISAGHGSVSVSGCTFSNNTCSDGGGIYVAVSGMTISNCSFDGNNATGFAGGGVLVHQSADNASITDCSFTNNSAVSAGGGLFGGGPGTTVTRCSFSTNTSDRGGGANFNTPSTTPTVITACTFSGNTSTGIGGAGASIYTGSGTVTVNFTNCTFSANTANGTGQGGGLLVYASGSTSLTSNLTNCTFSGNTSAIPANGISLNVGTLDAISSSTCIYRNTIFSGSGSTNLVASGAGTSTLSSNDNNLCSDGTGNLSGSHDMPNTVANLGPLTNNGGTTLTHMPNPGSAALDKGRFISGIATDQRGGAKPIDDAGIPNASNGDGSDVGAVEAPVLTGPEMDVSRASAAVLCSGVDTVTGAVATVTTVLTYNIVNNGIATLTLGTPVSAPGSLLNCSAGITTQPNSSLAPTAGTTLVVSVTPTSGGAFSCTISIANNDPNENPYTWTVSGNATPFGPEMDVSRSSVPIPDNGTDSAGVSFAAGSPFTLTYVVANTGNASLTLTNPAAISALNNCAVTITTAPSGSVAASSSTTTVLAVTPTAAGAFSFNYSIGNNDSNENPYNWTISGAAISPEIDVNRNAVAIADGGTDTVNGLTAGAPTALTYTIANTGGSILTLTLPASLGSMVNCSVSITIPPTTPVAASGSTTTTLSVTPTAAGSFSFTYSIGNNDLNENPYNWTVFGTAVSPEMDVTRGAAAIGDGGTDTLSGLDAGAPATLNYTISNFGTAPLTLTLPAALGSMVNCSVSVTVSPSSPVAASGSTSTTLTITPTAAGAFSCTYSIANNDLDENPYNWTISGTAVSPEMEVNRGAASITDGGTDTVSGTVAATPTALIYTFSNTGNAALTLALPASLGSMVNCSVSITAAPSTPVSASGSTSTTLTVTPLAAGVFSFTYSIGNNDLNESPYNWSISGTATAVPAPEIDVTRGATGIVDGGTDAVGTVVAGMPSSLTYTISNIGSAGLNLTGLPQLVAVTPGSNIATLSVTAQPAASVPVSGSTSFTVTFTVTGPGAFSFAVSIDNTDADENPSNWTTNGTGQVAAEIELSRGATSLPDGGADALGNVTPGQVLNLTYLITNSGGTALNVNAPVTLSSFVNCAANVAAQPATVVAPASTTTIVIDVTVAAAGPFSFSLSIGSDDADENPYDLAVNGTGVATGGGGGGSGGASGGCATSDEAQAWLTPGIILVCLAALSLRRRIRTVPW